MSRYFTRNSGWIEDETYSPEPSVLPDICVPEHEAWIGKPTAGLTGE